MLERIVTRIERGYENAIFACVAHSQWDDNDIHDPDKLINSPVSQ